MEGGLDNVGGLGNGRGTRQCRETRKWKGNLPTGTCNRSNVFRIGVNNGTNWWL